MKKQYIYSALVFTALLYAGCAKEFENKFDESDSAAIELSSVCTDQMTKAVITGTSFTTDEAAAGIGLFLLDAEGNAYGKNAGNVRYGYSDGKWTATSPLRVGNTAGTLVGYYPYSETATNVKAIPVASSIDGTDYLYGSIAGLTSANAKTGSLSLSHALTRLRITFKRDASFVGSGILSSLTIEGEGIAAKGSLDAITGIITATKSAFTVSGLNASINTDLTENCLIVPADANDTPQAVTLKFTVDGKAYKVELKDELSVKLASGIQTDITLTVKNTSVTVDGSSIGAWGEGGTKTVTIGGNYTVTIALADTLSAHDVLVDAYADGDDVIIRAASYSGQRLKCTMPDGDFCTSQSKTDKLIYNFTISDITENTTATIGYANPVSLITSANPEKSGSVKVVGDIYEGETVNLLPEAGYIYGIACWKDENGEVLSDGYDCTVRLLQDEHITACFEENLILGGEFTVDEKGKKVRFTRGNLYYNDSGHMIEQRQYDFNSADYTSRTAHVSHFMWCNDIYNAASLQYDNQWDGQTIFFTNVKGFTVSGIVDKSCFALSNNEWEHLLTNRNNISTVNNIDNARYFKGCINKEDGKAMNGLFILPDVFTWPASVKLQPVEINEAGAGYTNTYTYNDFKRLQDSGVVFLPAAGSRNGKFGEESISDVGFIGYYWSNATEIPQEKDVAYHLIFESDRLSHSGTRWRSHAQAVRLAIDVK